MCFPTRSRWLAVYERAARRGHIGRRTVRPSRTAALRGRSSFHWQTLGSAVASVVTAARQRVSAARPAESLPGREDLRPGAGQTPVHGAPLWEREANREAADAHAV
jgi:hypothetical protein